MTKKFSYHINNKNVCFYCEEELQNVADFFAQTLEKEDLAYSVLQNDKVIQIGWNYFKVIEQENEFKIVTYDLLNNPFEDTCEDLSLALDIFLGQSEVLNKTGCIPVETTFQNTMIIHKDALNSDYIYLERSQAKDNISGWYLAPVESEKSDNPDDYARIYTYQLLYVCRAALDIIQLPVGTLAIYKDGQLVEAVNEDNEKIL